MPVGKLAARVSRWARCTGGGVAVALAVAVPALVGAVGLGVDYATYIMLKSRLQAVADAAATAGARELSLASANNSPVIASVNHFVEAQAPANWGPVAVKPEVDRRKAQVRVELSQAWQPMFAKMFDSGVTPIVVSSKAKLIASATKLCVLALAPSALQSLNFDMSSKLTANGCAVYSNSRNLIAINVNINASVSASMVCAVGGVLRLLARSVKPDPITDCPSVPDPLAARQAPSFGACDFIDKVVSAGNINLAPGVYCGGLTVKGTAAVRLAPGEYIIKDGPLKISDNASVEGEHAGFYLTGDASVLDLGGNAQIRISGPKEGALAGLIVFEDRNVNRVRIHRIASTRADRLVGTIYLPDERLLINPNASVASNSAYTAIVAYQMELNEGPHLILNSDYEATDVPVPDGLEGNASVVLID